jgi:hypothetical protein
MKNSVRSQLTGRSSDLLACNHEIILKITCNKIVSVSEVYRCANISELINSYL